MRIDEDTVSVWETDRGFRRSYRGPLSDAPTPLLRAVVDLDSGEVTPPEADQHPDLFNWFRGEVDGELLDYLHALWMRSKGYETARPRDDVDLSGADPELLDRASTFSRLHPRDGVRVLAAFIGAPRAVDLTKDFAPLVSESANAILAAAKHARAPDVRAAALRPLVTAYVEDARFAPTWASEQPRSR